MQAWRFAGEIDPIIPPPQLIIAGAGHVGQALARQAVLIGFDVTIIDDWPEFCRSELFPPHVFLQGESRRMGSQKLLLPWAGKTVIEHIVDQLLLSRIDQVVIVTGHDYERLSQTLHDYPVELVYHQEYARDVQEVPIDAEGALWDLDVPEDYPKSQ